MAIVAVILVMAFMFLRAKRKFFAVMVLPLVSIPLFHIIGRMTFELFRFMDVELNVFLCMADLVGLLVGAVLCLVLSRGFPGGKGRAAYLVCCGVFLLALTGAYMLYLFP